MEVGLDTASGCEYNFTNLFVERASTVYWLHKWTAMIPGRWQPNRINNGERREVRKKRFTSSTKVSWTKKKKNKRKPPP